MGRVAHLAWGLLFVAACQCGTRVNDQTFACTAEADCVEGFVCRAGACVRDDGSGGGTSTGGGSAGGVAGGTGGGDAGGAAGGDAGGTAGGAAGGSAGGDAGGAAGGDAGGVAGGSAGGDAGGAAGGTAGGTAGGAAGGSAGGSAGGTVDAGPQPTSLVFTTMPPAPLLAGACIPAIVEARIGAAAQTVGADAPVGLTAAPSAFVGARFYATSSCAMAPISSTTIAAGTASATFYVKPVTGGAVTLTANASFGTAVQNLTVVPAVRRGSSCSFSAGSTLADGGTTVDTGATCTIPQAHQDTSHTLLFFQVTTSSGSTDGWMVRCRLNGTATISCDRNGAVPSAPIHWQTLELPTGLRVQRGTGSCLMPSPWTVTLPAAVTPASSFALVNVRSSGDYDDDNHYISRVVGPTTLQLEMGGDAGVPSCNGGSYDWQVAELQGLTTTEGVEPLPLPIGETRFTKSGLPATSLNAAILTQLRVPDNNDWVCNFMLRTTMPSQTSFEVTRGNGNDAGCSTVPVLHLGWQRLDFGARGNVQQKNVAFAAGMPTMDVTISPVDTTRTLVFASSQSGGGQSSGETSYSGTGNLFGEASARLELVSSTVVRATRSRSSYAGQISFYVVEIEP